MVAPLRPGEAGPDALRQVETIIVSDLHLGSEVARTRELLYVLRHHSFRRLVLNGDVFDDLNFHRLSTEDWDFLSFVRKLSNPKRECEVVWVAGNHDGVAGVLSHLLGVEVYDEYEWEQGGRRFLATHGHLFDTYITERPLLTELASRLYLMLQKIDREQQRLSRLAKRASKRWLSVAESVAQRAVAHARSRAADVILCGHTHIPGTLVVGDVTYVNSGCWTDLPSHYVTVDVYGEVAVHDWE